MISIRSLINFLITNIFIIFLGLLEYYIMMLDCSIINFMIVLMFNIFRNYCLIYVIQYVLKDKQFINSNRVQPVEKYYGEFHTNVLITSLVESVTILFIKQFITSPSNIFYDMITLIPISFLFEVIFDFFHYWTHRFSHMNKYMYEYSHKKHHMHRHVMPILTFYQHPIDIVISNVIPMILSLSIIRHISLFQFSIIMIYKTFTEISGHHGKKTFPNASFPQCIWLPKFLCIELYAEDHDLHHTLNNCNYAKRFALWDKLFGTYRPR
jgi:sterol desaturase/sphingolipid hydroxylase (fatty acid hydroxylase superfamily)